MAVVTLDGSLKHKSISDHVTLNVLPNVADRMAVILEGGVAKAILLEDEVAVTVLLEGEVADLDEATDMPPAPEEDRCGTLGH